MPPEAGLVLTWLTPQDSSKVDTQPSLPSPVFAPPTPPPPPPQPQHQPQPQEQRQPEPTVAPPLPGGTVPMPSADQPTDATAGAHHVTPPATTAPPVRANPFATPPTAAPSPSRATADQFRRPSRRRKVPPRPSAMPHAQIVGIVGVACLVVVVIVRCIWRRFQVQAAAPSATSRGSSTSAASRRGLDVEVGGGVRGVSSLKPRKRDKDN